MYYSIAIHTFCFCHFFSILCSENDPEFIRYNDSTKNQFYFENLNRIFQMVFDIQQIVSSCIRYRLGNVFITLSTFVGRRIYLFFQDNLFFILYSFSLKFAKTLSYFYFTENGVQMPSMNNNPVGVINRKNI